MPEPELIALPEYPIHVIGDPASQIAIAAGVANADAARHRISCSTLRCSPAVPVRPGSRPDSTPPFYLDVDIAAGAVDRDAIDRDAIDRDAIDRDAARTPNLLVGGGDEGRGWFQ